MRIGDVRLVVGFCRQVLRMSACDGCHVVVNFAFSYLNSSTHATQPLRLD